VEPLVKTAADLESLRWLFPEPRRDLAADIPLLLEEIGERAVVAAVDGTHAGSWGLEVLGPENMLMSAAEEPELLQAVCRLANDVHLRNVRIMLEQGIEVVYDSWFQCGPSVGWSPSTYREVFLPLVREAIELAHAFDALYIYQDDGRMRDIIPMLVEAGVDCLSGLQPPPLGDSVLPDLKAAYGGKVALYGGLDAGTTFESGDPQRVRDAVRAAITAAAADGGYVIGTGEAANPLLSSPECFRAAAETARACGVY
jgi:uroporphyrinogen decarboxylase